MSARTVHPARFTSLFHAHLLRIAGGTAALALLASTGCTVTEQVCVDEAEGEVTLENASTQWLCDGGLRYELTAVGETQESSSTNLICADGTFQAKSAAGAPCAPPAPNPPGVVDGRPMRVHGEAKTAPVGSGDAWIVRGPTAAMQTMPLTLLQRSILAAQWLRAATYEHASVASFARFTLDLMRFGAPPALLHAAQAAGADEVRHAELSFTLAQRFDADAKQPGALDLGAQLTLSPDLATFAADTFREGCVGETLAAVRAAERRAVATDPAVCDVLDVLIEDEGEHAKLAWSTVQWAIAEGGQPVIDAIAAAAQQARSELMAPPRPTQHPEARQGLRAFGVLSPAAESRALRVAWDAVIAPALAGLVRSSL